MLKLIRRLEIWISLIIVNTFLITSLFLWYGEILAFDNDSLLTESEAKEISDGKLKKGEIKKLGEEDRFVFEGEVNDQIVLLCTKIEGDLWPKIELYGPDGVRVASAYGSLQAEVTYTLKTTGRFGILVRDGFNGTYTGKYRLEIDKLN